MWPELRSRFRCIPVGCLRARRCGKVKRNVVMLCEIPAGQHGRPSKALTLDQAETVLTAAESSPLCAYIVLSLLIGARTEELRALTWDHVDLIGQPDADPEVAPSIAVWRSVRTDGDTKTRRSRRTLRMPTRCVEALRRHQWVQQTATTLAGTNSTSTTSCPPQPSALPLTRTPTRVPQSGQGGRPDPGRVDTTRDETQLRITAVRIRSRTGRHRPTGRPQRHSSHRNRLSQAD